MRIASLAAFGIAGLGTLAVVLPGGTSGAHALDASPSREPFVRRNVPATPTPCYGNYRGSPAPQFFVGITANDEGNNAGGDYSAVLGGTGNQACDENSGIGTGVENGIGNSGNAFESFIGAGRFNRIFGADSFIGAGQQNVVSGNRSFDGAGMLNSVVGTESFVGAGNQNTVTGNDAFVGAGTANFSSGVQSFLGAGSQNGIETARNGFLGAGENNNIEESGTDAALPGGRDNIASAEYASLLGGFGNLASGEYATVLGGDSNVAAGILSLAGGYHADASHNGSFVWSDYVSGSTTLQDSAPNQFVVRASGGVKLYSNEAETSGVLLAAGSGTWANLSDRNAKSDIVLLDDGAVLAKVSALPIGAWSYKSEAGVRHVGPMAQDFYAAFGLGPDDKHIVSIDEDGVALSAIKGIYREQMRLKSENDRIAARIVALERPPLADALQRYRPRTQPVSTIRRRENPPQPCVTNFAGVPGPQYLVGITAGAPGDVAGGADSTALGGANNEACAADSGIFAGSQNIVSAAGTASESFIAAGYQNAVEQNDSLVGAGESNLLNAGAAFIGSTQTGMVTGFQGLVGSGFGDLAAGSDAFAGGGSVNAATGSNAFVGAGESNADGANNGFLGDGSSNTIAPTATDGVLLGGRNNVVSAPYAAVLGGFGNTASGEYAVVSGGNGNTASAILSFAAGYHASATHPGSFVWSDFSSGSPLVSDSASNQFIVRESGGTVFYTNEAATTGVSLPAGSGSWASISDRDAKTGFTAVDDSSVLARVAALPVNTWRYSSEEGVRHAGPMAQDFYAAFGVGADDRHISQIDEAGIALAAIAALHDDDRRLDASYRSIDAGISSLGARNATRIRGGGAVQPSRSAEALRTFVRRNDPPPPTPCKDYGGAPSPQYFVGISANDPGDDAGGQFSASLGGYQNQACGPESGIGAGLANGIQTVLGGNAFIGSGRFNEIDESLSFIGAGLGNHAGLFYSTVGAGSANESTGSSFIGAGATNIAASSAFIGAGAGNAATESGFVGAGASNEAKEPDSFVGAGESNLDSDHGAYAVIGAGNDDETFGEYAAVLGGYSNRANGSYAVVPGGFGTQAAGELTFAAGYHALAQYAGSFVWSDYAPGTPAQDTAPNQFVVRATGGVRFTTNEGSTAGVMLLPGSGSWASSSDRAAKTDIVPLDDAAVLAKVAALPVSMWRYRSERGVRHAGPMAQDFYATFGLGTDDRHITPIDEDGVALSAIKALSNEYRLLRRRNLQLQMRLAVLERRGAAAK